MCRCRLWLIWALIFIVVSIKCPLSFLPHLLFISYWTLHCCTKIENLCVFFFNDVFVNPFQFFLQFGPWVRRSSVKLMIRTLTVVSLKLGIIYSYTESTERSYIFMLSLKIIAQNKYLIAYNYNMMNYNCNKF